jgi:PhnB protein
MGHSPRPTRRTHGEKSFMNDSVNALIPALSVHDGAEAIAFYQQAFGATELYRLIDPESGQGKRTRFVTKESCVLGSVVK